MRLVETKQPRAGKLREELNLKAQLLDAATDSIFLYRPDGSLIYVNEAAYKSRGYSQKELMAMSVWELAIPEMAELFESQVKEIMAKGEATFESAHLHKDGTSMPVETHSRVIKVNSDDFILSVCRDITVRKQLEEFATTLINSAQIGVYVIQDGKFKLINSQIMEVTGFSQDQLLGTNAISLVHPEDRVRVRENAVKMLKGEHLEPYEFRVCDKSGNIKVVMEAVAPVTYKGKRATLGNFMDITERKQAEELYRNLANSTPVGVYIVQDGKFQFVNPQFQKYTGFSQNELLGTESLRLVHPEDRERVRENAVAMLKGERLPPYELRYFVKGGNILWATETVTSIEYGGKRATLGNFMDITEHKQAEEALRESREQLQKMFESVTDGISVIDLNGAITEVNQRMVEIHGSGSKKNLLGRNALELVTPADHERITNNMRQALKQGTVSGVEYTLIRADGTEFPAELSTSALRNASGNWVGHITIVRDITERKVMQEQLMLTDRLASIGELASGIAHELNNPLTSIIGFSQLLMEREIADDIKEDLKLVHSEAQRSANIVKNLLTFARKHAPVKQLSQINGIIEDVLKLRAYEQKVSNIEVVKKLDPNLPQIMIDHFLIQQVFLNIIINAEYFMIEAHNKGKLTITTKKDDSNVRISFADDGPGISPENLSRIFHPFFTTKDVGKGTGLGLSICHGIVAEHNGNAYATSQLGKGATFIIELPIQAP
jgi:two-component system NtrC family sensor kinase